MHLLVLFLHLYWLLLAESLEDSEFRFKKSGFNSKQRRKFRKGNSLYNPTDSVSNSCAQNSSSSWCGIKMPSKSYFRFSTPPNDSTRWEIAKTQALRGEQVLLKKILKWFPFYLDFLDGDTAFRNLHKVGDIFLDENRDFSPLLANFALPYPKERKKVYEFESKGVTIPPPYNFRKRHRAPVVMIGYRAFTKRGGEYFEGNLLGGSYMERHNLFTHWKNLDKDAIDTPFILVHSHNENYGILSTLFPNRTANWGICCTPQEYATLMDILNHNKTLMFLTNQHNNITHPKLLTMPRGMPIYADLTKKIIWDTMRTVSRQRKKRLLFSASSSAILRVKIMECVSKKFTAADLEAIKFGEENKGRLEPEQYYRKLATSMVGLAMPGVGYDTFRLWETLTLGVMVVLEKAVGFDKTLWRLPALLVEDFDEVTPELLQAAYVEALYRVDEFEFQRLTQSYWHSLIGKVSDSMSSQPLFEMFPPEADEQAFCRPAIPFDCGPNQEKCGPGTKRTPQRYC